MARLIFIVNIFIIFNLTARVAATYPTEDDLPETPEPDDTDGDCDDETCPTNEMYSNCTQNVCRELTCMDRGKPLACNTSRPVEPSCCKKGCVCIPGFVRTEAGKCIPENQCYGSLVCDDTEIVDTCPNYSSNDRCPRSQEEAEISSQVVSGPCAKKPICTCKINHKRNEKGVCIPTRDCPPFECKGKYEEYNACPPFCPSGDCSQATPTGKCPLPGRIGILLICRPSCRCIPGYFKNNGICVPYAECPGICPENERYSTNSTETSNGKPGCVCIKGTYRNENGKCVKPPTCDKNEYFNTCPGGCDPVNCPKSYKDEQDYLAKCITTLECKPPRCACNKFYRRDSNGKCIYIGQCPNICGENEKFTEGTNSTGGEPGCVCIEGTYRNENGKCVKPPTCGKNEYLNKCPGGCDPVNCPKSYKDEQDYLAKCVTTADCKPPRCACNKFYRRDCNGKCIYIGQCPNICGINEKFTEGTNSTNGKPGCVCIEGTYRDENGKCVKPPTCGKNEYFNKCPGGCDPVNCPKSYKDEQDYLAKCVTTLECKPPRCSCNKFYRRDCNGKCIYIGTCPGICPENEKYTEGTNSTGGKPGCVCIEGTSRNENGKCVKPPTCGENETYNKNSTGGKPGCVCIEGTYRNEKGKCVKPPTCGENEYLNTCPGGCDPVNCPKSYKYEQDYLAKCVTTLECKPPRCACNKFYRRDCNGKCIYIGKCPNICGENEKFTEGTNSTDGKPGCVCIEGTYRNENGKCVKPPTCGKNEYFNKCPGGCDPVNCPKSYKDEQDYLAKCVTTADCKPPRCACNKFYRRDCNGKCIYIGECPNICGKNEKFTEGTNSTDGKPGCVCIEGTYRDENGKCVKPPTCGENEYFNTCPGGCDPVNCPKSYKDEQDYLAKCITTLECKPPRCACNKFYRRDCNGKCIYIGQCPNICGENEKFTEGTNSTGGEPGCVCIEGTYRNENGKCVKRPPPPQCGTNEVLACVNECPPQKTCRTRNIQVRCMEPTKPCEEKCICKPDYYRNPLGECISNAQCDQCNKTNQFFTCGPECNNTCADLTQNRTNCRIVNIRCNEKCYCDDGYAEDCNGNCIPVDQCPKNNKCCGMNEEYVQCKQTCPPEHCVSIVSRFDCTNEPPCKPGCACKSGFFRQDEDSPCMDVCNCNEMKSALQCKNKC